MRYRGGVAPCVLVKIVCFMITVTTLGKSNIFASRSFSSTTLTKNQGQASLGLLRLSIPVAVEGDFQIPHDSFAVDELRAESVELLKQGSQRLPLLFLLVGRLLQPLATEALPEVLLRPLQPHPRRFSSPRGHFLGFKLPPKRITSTFASV